MPKHARKRRKVARDEVVQPLGSNHLAALTDDANKDDEERRLESRLFGVSLSRRRAADSRELEHMLDSDLFFIDDGAAPSSSDSGTVPDATHLSIDKSHIYLRSSPKNTDQTTSAEDAQPRRKAPAWVDPDDANLQVSLTAHTRLRKLRDAPSEDTGQRSRGKNRGCLTQGVISVDRLRDANQAAPAEGEIKSVQFHPSPQIPVLLTASTDRRLRLFHVDGLTNPHAQTLHVPSLPITNASSHRSPRGLWGTTFSSANQDASMETSGRRGHIHLVDWRSGSAQVVAGLKANAAIKSLWWSRVQNGELLSLTQDSQVYVWDVRQRKCVRRWQDEGGFGSKIMSGDQQGNYLSIGSNIGLVNVYNARSLGGDSKPKPLKTIGNLTTNISCLQYNHDAQLLAMASDVKRDQLRLVHLPSLTVYGNWPTSKTPLAHVTSMDFAVGSEYLAIGNNKGRALLYHLRDLAQQ
ncbi:WD40 repeat-like protein [Pisolithus croceorrhizus]|nr:WD40 repeat-like protein [Pisolithus croceorrhizus]